MDDSDSSKKSDTVLHSEFLQFLKTHSMLIPDEDVLPSIEAYGRLNVQDLVLSVWNLKHLSYSMLTSISKDITYQGVLTKSIKL